MGLLGLFRRLDRRAWFICYNCMNNNGHQAEQSIFFYQGPPEMIDARPWVRCPRCQDLNTRSFQFLKDEGEEPALWGLERIVKKHPQGFFPVKPPPRSGASA